MIEDDLRAAFARHEALTPAIGPVRETIDRTAVRRRRRRLVVRASGAALAVLVAVAVPVVGRRLASTPPPAPAAEVTPSTTPAPDAALNFLVLGLDQFPDQPSHRADTILIVHVPRDRSRAYLISIPRDLGVRIPGHGFGKINSAFYFGSRGRNGKADLVGGVRLTEQVLRSLTGLRFDGTAVVTYAGLRKLTDAVGGVRMCLDREITSIHTGRVFPAGCQQLDGRAALDVLRQRKAMPEGSHDRDRDGQRFVKALLAEVASGKTLSDPVKAAAIVRVAGDGLILDTGDLAMADLIGALHGIAASEPVGVGWTFNTRGAYERLDPTTSSSLFEAVRQDTLDDWAKTHPSRITKW